MVDDIEDELAALRRSYAIELPAKARAIGEAIAMNDRSTAVLLAHRLRGTAGSYGFADVSGAAATVEELLGSGAPVEDACAALLAAADAAAGSE